MSAVPNRGTKPHVLVADDSKVIRRAVAKILGNDFELIEAEDGEAAWDQLGKDGRIEVLMTDIEMPRLDGYGLICRVRAADKNQLREIPIIVITGAEDDVTRERAYACGATDFITKPIDGVQLLARTRAHAKLDEAVRKLGEMENTIEQQTANDALTQLRSQRYVFERGEQDLAFAKRRGTELSVVRLDVDNFRALYDAHGDDVCNQLTIWVSKIVQSCIRTEDTAARMRGAHFTVLMPGTAPTAAAVVAERIRTTVASKPFTHAGVTVKATVSVGLVTLGRDKAENFKDLMHSAERNLTLAKADGGNRLSIGYEDSLHVAEESVIEQPDMETAIRLIEKNDGGKLLPYLPELITRLLPFLEHANRNLDLDISDALQTLKEKLRTLK